MRTAIATVTSIALALLLVLCFAPSAALAESKVTSADSIPVPELPKIPDKKFNVSDYGTKAV